MATSARITGLKHKALVVSVKGQRLRVGHFWEICGGVAAWVVDAASWKLVRWMHTTLAFQVVQLAGRESAWLKNRARSTVAKI